ncbi:ATP-binding protein [Enterobacter ludwigii]|uniref:ATP-binding protein n=1 Tax=Enterobacter ludwigii TaxID=299767 RepID=UPI0024076761|nr:ATP-binding protein [Enterobacter ludwigii]MDF9918004.1 ATP-binding protein [Enterobacter ludwigii]
MIQTLAFRTQARTVDHLGREQIADCPTAISELWKNAYDAYARNVSLHLFDEQEPVAAVFDDGHGMNFEEFVNRWLVVGTTSKYENNTKDDEDRDGLPKRTRQGQKGIGRLSSANLGPLLLIVTKRKNTDFVAALIDWRIFENPYLVLSDIEVPVTEFKNKDQLFVILPQLFNRLLDNIQGDKEDTPRSQRLKLAWETYDRVVQENSPSSPKPSAVIASTIVNARFEEHHLTPWSVWEGSSSHGSALIVSDINYDLRAQLPSVEPDGNVNKIREALVSTLSAFTDPYVDNDAIEFNAFAPEFSYEVRIWSGAVSKMIVEDERRSINRDVLEEAEHLLSGNIDAEGIFKGQIKAFGQWLFQGSDYIIYPPKDFKLPSGPTTLVGPFSLTVATYERTQRNTTLSETDWARFEKLADEHGGFLLFRNGLRVLPYGRTDNDFFEIETRRSISAGREFWNARRMFGRVAISREQNPNLKDKAGREGFIDNRSAKALRALVIHILRTAAYQYFGQASELRNQVLPDVQAKYDKEKADKERQTLSAKNASRFRSNLRKNLPILNEIYAETENILFETKIENEQDLINAQSLITRLTENMADLRLSGAPAKLGAIEDDYRAYRAMYADITQKIKELEDRRATAIELIKPAKPEEIAQKQLNSHSSRLQARLRAWRKAIETIQNTESERVASLFDERNKAFHQDAMPLVENVRLGRCGLDDALAEMKAIFQKLDSENEDTFQSYLYALEIMSENINIELIARQGTAENVTLREDLNRLNQVAQLGITVEILGHELASNERMVYEGIRQIQQAGQFAGTELIVEGFEALSQQLEFLSPLKISGTKARRLITGREIEDYLNKFFGAVIRNRKINIHASEEFRQFALYEQPSRIYPVFVNLVNNSVYWMVNSHTDEPEVFISVEEERIVISDNGPGINPVDQEHLFKMFFTRKSSGGRGIGLYLCRTNLQAGGHSIAYTTERKFRRLSGANFVIDFKGATFG